MCTITLFIRLIIADHHLTATVWNHNTIRRCNCCLDLPELNCKYVLEATVRTISLSVSESDVARPWRRAFKCFYTITSIYSFNYFNEFIRIHHLDMSKTKYGEISILELYWKSKFGLTLCGFYIRVGNPRRMMGLICFQIPVIV